MTNEIPFFNLKWKSGQTSLEPMEPDEFVYEKIGTIVSYDENEQEELVGKFRLYYVDVIEAFDDGHSPFSVFDAHSDTTCHYHETLYEFDSLDFKEEVLRLCDHEVSAPNLLILDRVEILPQYRGQNLGLIVMRRLIQRFSSGAGLVAMKVFPLQFEHERLAQRDDNWRSEMRLSEFSKEQESATDKLCQYYSKLGFVRLAGEPYMIFPTVMRLPSIEDLPA